MKVLSRRHATTTTLVILVLLSTIEPVTAAKVLGLGSGTFALFFLGLLAVLFCVAGTYTRNPL
jgi:hypothetical protein